jgi:tetratricopeptide (TPR) repeat protein
VREAVATAARADKVAEPSEALKRARAQMTELAARRKALLEGVGPAADKSVPWGVAVDAFLAADQALRAGEPAARVEKLLAGAFVLGVDLGPAYALRGLLALERGRLSKALADADRAVVLSPGESRAYLVRGRVRLERLHKDALADLAKAAKLSRRSDGEILHWLAAAQFQVGQREQALATQRAAVLLRPGDAEAAEQLRQFEQAAGLGQAHKSTGGE